MRWKKKNGNEIETNDSQVTQDYMKSQGCVVIDGPATPKGDPDEVPGPTPVETHEITQDEMPSQGDPQEPEAA